MNQKPPEPHIPEAHPPEVEGPKRSGKRASPSLGRRFLRAVFLVVILLIALNWLTYPSDYLRKKEKSAEDLNRLQAALLQFKQEEGRYPDRLEELQAAGFVDEVPADPFHPEAAAYRYLNYGDGRIVRVYSVGLDGVDHKTYADSVIMVEPPANAVRSLNDYFYEFYQIHETSADPDNNIPDYMRALIQIRANQFNVDTPVDVLMAIPEKGLEEVRATNPEGLDKVLRWMEAETGTLNLVRQGAAKPRTEAAEAWLGTFRFSDARALAQMLIAQGHLFESRGQLERALENYYTVLEFGMDMASSHRMMGFMLQESVGFMALQALERVLAKHELTAEQLRSLMETVGRWKKECVPLVKALEQEQEVVNLHLLVRQRIELQERQTAHLWDRLSAWALLPFGNHGLEQDRERSEALWAEVQKNLNRPYEEAIRLDQTALHRESEVDADLAPPDSIIPYVRERRLLSYVAAVRIMAALELYRQEQGTYPDRLDALAPYLDAVPEDSFDGIPFAYESGGDTFRLHSLGPDLTDQQQAAVYDPTNGVTSEGDILYGGP